MEQTKKKITIRHLYPDLLNLYGDRGNIGIPGLCLIILWHARRDSKGGSFKQSSGLFEPPWLFRRKANPSWRAIFPLARQKIWWV